MPRVPLYSRPTWGALTPPNPNAVVQHVQGACCVAVVGQSTATTPEQLTALLEGASEADGGVEIYAFDHIYGGGKPGTPGAVNAVLYGALGTRCLQSMHGILASHATRAPPGDLPVCCVPLDMAHFLGFWANPMHLPG